MNIDLTDEETAALLKELDGLIDGDRYFLSPRIKTLRAIRAKIQPEPVREPLPPPPKRYEPPRATAAETAQRAISNLRTHRSQDLPLLARGYLQVLATQASRMRNR